MSACNTRNVYCRIIKIITFNDSSLSLWLKLLIFNIKTLQKCQDYLGQVVLSLAITEQVDQHQNTVNCWNSGTLQSCKAKKNHYLRMVPEVFSTLASFVIRMSSFASGRSGKARRKIHLANRKCFYFNIMFLECFATWRCRGPSGRTLQTSPWRPCSNPSPPV